MPLSAQQIEQLVNLGINEEIAQNAKIAEDQFDYMLHGLTVLLSPKEGKGVYEPVRIVYSWQLELLVGQLDNLPEHADIIEKKGDAEENVLKEIADWKDTRGLNIAHYIALSGNAIGLENVLGAFPTTLERESYTIKGKPATLAEIARYYDDFDVKKDGEHITAISGCDQSQCEGLTHVYDDLIIEVEDEGKPKIRKDRQQKTIAHYAGLAQVPDAMNYLLDNPLLAKRLWTQDLPGGPQNKTKRPEFPQRKLLDEALNNAVEQVVQGKESDKDIELLMEFSADPMLGLQLENGKTIAHVAAEVGNCKVLKILKRKKPQLFLSTDDEENNIAHYAARANKLEVLEFLYKKAPTEVKNLWVKNTAGQLPEDLANDRVVGEIRQAAVLEARKRLKKGKAKASDIQLLLELNAFQKNEKRQTLAHLAAIGGDIEAIKYMFKKAPALVKQLWIRDANGRTPHDVAHREMKEKPGDILSEFLEGATGRMRAGNLSQEDVGLLLAFKDEWKVMIAKHNQHRVATNMNGIDCDNLTRSKLLHLLLLTQDSVKSSSSWFSSSQPKKSILVLKLEEFIKQLTAEEIDEDQMKCLKVIVEDYERNLLGLKDKNVNTLANKISKSNVIRALSGGKRKDADDNLQDVNVQSYAERFEVFIAHVKDLPQSPSKSFVLGNFYRAMYQMIHEKDMVIGELLKYAQNRRNDCLLYLNGDIPYHLENIKVDGLYIKDLHERSRLHWDSYVRSFLSATEAAYAQGKLSQFCASINSGYCLESRTRELIIEYGGHEQGELPSFTDLLENYITEEYMPYEKVMHQREHSCDIVERAANFILLRHDGEACSVSEKDKEYAPDKKITRVGVEQYLIKKREYKRVDLSGEQPDADDALDKIHKYVKRLQRESKYMMNYFSRSVKKSKIDALEELERKIKVDGLTVKNAAIELKKGYPEASEGFFSQRTKKFLNDLEHGRKPKMY